MSSYNNIRKIKYTKTPTDVVALQEYILFESARSQEKYVVFKFANNVNQRLFTLKFEVLQYNADGDLIEKSTVLHKDFKCEANDTFVPNAKLKVNFECDSLEVKLIMASFDRVVWLEGEFKDNSYRFESYAETVAQSAQTVSGGNTKTKKQLVAEKKQEKSEAKKRKRNKLGYSIRNIFRRNKAAFPAVFNVIFCLLFIGAVIFSTFYFKNVTDAVVVDDYVIKQSSGYASVLYYGGESTEIEIPQTLGDYRVTKICSGAFKGSNVKKVKFSNDMAITIESGAFENCASLQSVTGDGTTVNVMESAFINCKKLTTFSVTSAILCKGCFDGANAISTLTFYNVAYSYQSGKLIELFKGEDRLSLKVNMLGATSVPQSFYDGISLRR